MLVTSARRSAAASRASRLLSLRIWSANSRATRTLGASSAVSVGARVSSGAVCGLSVNVPSVMRGCRVSKFVMPTYVFGDDFEVLRWACQRVSGWCPGDDEAPAGGAGER